MGLLDDAIKEHLELKRRHGADPGEVARLEHEALGPARREPAGAGATVADEPALEDYEDEVPAEERLERPVDYDEPQAPAVEPEPEAEAHVEPEPPAAELHEVPEFEPAPPPPEREDPAPVEQPTRQFSLEELEDASSRPGPDAPAEEPEEEPHADVVPADDEPESEDVLEETPEFLQETPEHDRLWFEQKPPKDFDF
jgi:hypothetical protein